MTKIVTAYDPPPIPTNKFDWQAIDDNSYEPGCPIGFGATEEEAIEDLLKQLAMWEEQQATRMTL